MWFKLKNTVLGVGHGAGEAGAHVAGEEHEVLNDDLVWGGVAEGLLEEVEPLGNHPGAGLLDSGVDFHEFALVASAPEGDALPEEFHLGEVRGPVFDFGAEDGAEDFVVLDAVIEGVYEEADVLLADADFAAGPLEFGALFQHQFGGEFDAHLVRFTLIVVRLSQARPPAISIQPSAGASDYSFSKKMMCCRGRMLLVRVQRTGKTDISFLTWASLIL